MKRTTLVSGPPGSGKTTGYIENLAKTTDKMIYVLEPVQSIVREKKQGLELVKDGFIENANIEFINYAEGFSDKFYHKGHREDIIIIDEAHTLFFTDYRNFDIKKIEDFLELYDEVIFMTATPHILEIYLRGKGIEYETIAYKQRLKRDHISIRIIPTKFFTFLEDGVSENYDIIISNNILNIKKLEIELEEKLDDFTFIYSYNNETNNLLFQKKEYKQNQWIGTCALGQGLNKKTSIEPGIGRILMDGNTFKQVPDMVKWRYEKNPGTREHKTVLYTTLAENLIQTDRFRKDLDLYIDLVIDIELEDMDLLEDILRGYIKGVYGKSAIEIERGNGLYAGKQRAFSIERFREAIELYNPKHNYNCKDQRERFLELLNDWCNPVIDGIRSGKPGNYKNTLRYFELIADKFYNSAIEDGNIDWIFFDNKLELKNRGMALYKGMRDFVRALRDGDIKGKIERYIMDDKRWREDQKPDDLRSSAYLQMDYLGDALLQILFGIFGIKYSIEGEEMRGGSPIQLIQKALRRLIIVKDIDVSGCHIVALIKKILGDNFIVDRDMIERIYSYNAFSKEGVAEYMRSFKKLRDVDIEEYFGGERAVCKNAILWAVNRLKFGLERDYEYVQNVLGGAIKEMKGISLRGLGELGYYNGIAYEEKWLGEWNGYRGVVFRIADGLCQAYGNGEILMDIREEIMNTYGIPVSIEDIELYDRIGIDISLDDYISGAIDRIEIGESFMDIFRDTMREMEELRRYLRKGKYVGKAKGKAKGKAISIKEYRIVRDFTIKETGEEWKEGDYKWKKIPETIPASYRQRYLKKKK